MSTAVSQQWDSPGCRKANITLWRQKRSEQNRTVAERLSVSWWCKPGLGWVGRVCTTKHTRTHAHGDTSNWVGNTFEAPFHMLNLRGGISHWHVWMCSVYAFWFDLLGPGWVGLRVSGCWDTRAAEHTWLLTEFSNRLVAVDSNAPVALGGQGTCFLHLPQNSFAGSIFTPLKQTHSPSGMRDLSNKGLFQTLSLHWFAGLREWTERWIGAAEFYWAHLALLEWFLARKNIEVSARGGDYVISH